MKTAKKDIVNANMKVDDDQTRSMLHFDGESFIPASDRLASLRLSIAELMKKNDVNSARSNLGGALHTLQDFYSHSNYLENGATTTYSKLEDGVTMSSSDFASETKETCEKSCTECEGCSCDEDCSNILTTSTMTSGYYKDEDRSPAKGVVKCWHGGNFDGQYDGINKDSSACKTSPHYYLHFDAAKLATEVCVFFFFFW
jgi:von Willebrand factor A domain-containing protein 7